MKKYHLFKKLFSVFIVLAGFTLVSCSDDNNDETPTTESKDYYVLLTGDLTTSPYVGYGSTYTEFPSGNIDNIKTGSVSMRTNGMRSYGEWVFKRTSLGKEGGEDEIIRYAIDATGNLVESGRITSGNNSNYYIYNETTAFYIDLNRDLMKIQKFNPSTMQRTGEIDLSSLRNADYPYQDVGTNLMVAKDGKLYVDVFYNTANEKGNFIKNTPLGFAELAVIDLTSEKYEKSIRNNNISYIGYPGNENQMWSIGDDGALYMCSHGFGATGATNKSAIVRIKKNATDFDNNWIIYADDYMQGTSMGVVCVKDGKLYTQMGSQALSFRGNLTDVVYDYYVFDTENLSAGRTKVLGMPQSTYTFQCAQGIIVINDKIYFRVVNNNDENGYYVLGSNNTASRAFNVTSGGVIWGIAKLSKAK
ncbi:MAG: hypothetical protein QM653_03135 [Dysgonomonas sp.]|uniref:hypothetical protein n=1 Tax=Dysgonomonas sp. TaxID=1891233 RepID=UPI0039E4E1C3